VNDLTLEQTVRDALHDAADHASLAAPAPLADAPTSVTSTRGRRPRVLVTACAVAAVVALVVAGVALARDDGSVRVSSPIPAAREVPASDIPRAATDVVVFLNVQANEADIQSVRDLLETSPDVVHYAYVDRDAAYREFAEIYSCNPDLVHSIRPQDLPVSFRVIATAPDTVDGLRATLKTVPGVASAEASSDPTSPANTRCSETTQAPKTLPPAGEQPTDPSAARDAVVGAFTQAWDGTSSAEQRRAAIEDFKDTDQLVAAFDQAHLGDPTGITTMRAEWATSSS
jgi:hypothetical protein